MVQQLRNAVVAPNGMGKNYGRIMPRLRQGWLVNQKIMHYGFLTMLLRMPLQPRGNIPIAANITFLEDSLGQYKKNFQYIHQQILDKGVFGLKFLLFTRSRIT